MKKLRVAQIGCSESTHARQIFSSLMRQTDLFEVVAIADVDHHRAERDERFNAVPLRSAEEILNDTTLDAVFIECDEVLATRYAIAAAERGFPIFMDKPGSPSDGDFDHLIDLIEEKRLPFAIGYMYRTNPAVLQLLEEIKSGKLGEIYSVEAQMSCLQKDFRREFFKTLPGGMLYYLGCHLIDLIYQIQGEPDEVLPLSCSIAPEKGFGEDFGMTVFQYPKGVSFARTCGAEVGGFTRRQLVVHGTKGSFEINPLEILAENDFVSCKIRRCYADDPENHGWNYDGIREEFPAFNRYDATTANFAAYLRGEKQNPYTPDYERILHKLILKACGVK
ncbi:MAG: Gfo/Idh/MocA family oxidoreductase [Clostridia bacterium]|nr:Gfo/Idh/MocA family oxidoreductase [Clostridia bacterium]